MLEWRSQQQMVTAAQPPSRTNRTKRQASTLESEDLASNSEVKATPYILSLLKTLFGRCRMISMIGRQNHGA
jgi:hypothetical protein